MKKSLATELLEKIASMDSPALPEAQEPNEENDAKVMGEYNKALAEVEAAASQLWSTIVGLNDIVEKHDIQDVPAKEARILHKIKQELEEINHMAKSLL